MKTAAISISNQWHKATCPKRQGRWLLLLESLAPFALQKDSCPWQIVVRKELSQFLVLKGQSRAENPAGLKDKDTTQHHCLVTKSTEMAQRQQKWETKVWSTFRHASTKQEDDANHCPEAWTVFKDCQNSGVAATKGQDYKRVPLLPHLSLYKLTPGTCQESPKCNLRKCLFYQIRT